MLSKLSDLKINISSIIVSISGEDTISIRLRELGFVKDTTVKIIYKSVFNRCAVVSLRGYLLTLRENALERVLVTNE